MLLVSLGGWRQFKKQDVIWKRVKWLISLLTLRKLDYWETGLGQKKGQTDRQGRKRAQFLRLHSEKKNKKSKKKNNEISWSNFLFPFNEQQMDS